MYYRSMILSYLLIVDKKVSCTHADFFTYLPFHARHVEAFEYESGILETDAVSLLKNFYAIGNPNGELAHFAFYDERL